MKEDKLEKEIKDIIDDEDMLVNVWSEGRIIEVIIFGLKVSNSKIKKIVNDIQKKWDKEIERWGYDATENILKVVFK